MTISKFHQAARRYASKGWPVFPLHPGTKVPLGSLAPDGYKNATTNLDLIDMWWTDEPNANIGFAPGGAGMYVVDEDTDKGGDWPEVLYHVKTPHGRHIYYAGECPQTASKLGPCIDTRGATGYVVVPPSALNSGERYEWVSEPSGPWDLHELDPDVLASCHHSKEPRKAPEGVEWDKPEAIKEAVRYLATVDPEEGLFIPACRLKDLGISPDQAIEMLASINGDDYEWAEQKVEHAWEHGQNEPGSDTPQSPQERYGAVQGWIFDDDPDVAMAGNPKRSPQDWVPHDPRDPTEMPEIEFWDPETKLIPKSPDGYIGVLYGKRGDHKTNTVLSLLCRSSATRILYSAGEGAFGVEKQRLPARPELVGRIKLLPKVPLFASEEQVRAFIAGTNSLAPWKPDVVVLDTLATAIAGEDENSSMAAAHLTDNGACGAIKQAWGCTVIVIGHAGKDLSKGLRGTSAFEGNIDFLVEIEAKKDTRTVTAYAVKMRDAEEGYTVHFKYGDGVPVPEAITEREWLQIQGASVKGESPDTAPVGMMVQSFLRLNGHHAWTKGLETKELAACLAEQELGARPEDVDAAAMWVTCRERWVKALYNAKGKAWGKAMSSEQVQPGGEKMILRWFSIPPEQHGEPEY